MIDKCIRLREPITRMILSAAFLTTHKNSNVRLVTYVDNVLTSLIQG